MTNLEKVVFIIGLVLTILISIYTQKTTRYVGIIDRIEDEKLVVVLIENKLEEIIFQQDEHAGDWTEGDKVTLLVQGNNMIHIKKINKRVKRK